MRRRDSYLPDLAQALTEWRRVDPRTAYNHWLAYGFVDQLRNAPPATADAVYDNFNPVIVSCKTAGSAQSEAAGRPGRHQQDLVRGTSPVWT